MITVKKQDLLYEGKAKRIFKTNDANVLWVEYKDSATAFNGQKRAEIAHKGELNNRISSVLFTMLSQEGVENHFLQRVTNTEQLVKPVQILPLEVVVRNVAAGSISKRLGIAEGLRLKRPVVEFYYKDDALQDPLVTLDHIEVFDLAPMESVAQMREQALRINDILVDFFQKRRIRLVDAKFEFGHTGSGTLLLADEISPDTCRLWDLETADKLDKDRFRRELGEVTQAYQEILKRVEGDFYVQS